MTLTSDVLLDTAGLVSREAPYSLLAVHLSGVLTQPPLPRSAVLAAAVLAEARRGVSSPTRFEARSSSTTAAAPSPASTRAQGVSMEPDLYDNDSYSLKGVYFLPTSAAGIHEIHSGYERFSESARRDQPPLRKRLLDPAGPRDHAGNDVLSHVHPARTRIEWYPILQPSLGSELVTDSGFLEDRLQLGRHWSFNLGVRYDRNRDRDSRGELVVESGSLESAPFGPVRPQGRRAMGGSRRIRAVSGQAPRQHRQRGVSRGDRDPRVGATGGRASTAIPSLRR